MITAYNCLRLKDVGVSLTYPFSLLRGLLIVAMLLPIGVLLVLYGHYHLASVVVGAHIGFGIGIPWLWRHERRSVLEDFTRVAARIQAEPVFTEFNLDEHGYTLLTFDFYKRQHPRARFTVSGQPVEYTCPEKPKEESKRCRRS